MIKNISKFHFFSILEITPDKLSNFVDSLKKYFDSIDFSSKLINHQSVEFASLKELLNYNNFSNERLKNVTINMRKDYDDSLSLSINNDGTYSYFLKLFENLEFEKVIIQEIEYLRRSSTVANGFVCFLLYLLRCAIIFFILNVLEYNSNTFKTIFSNYILVEIIIAVLLHYLIIKIQRYFIPNAVFLWGDEISRIKRMKMIRSAIITIIGVFLTPLVTPFVIEKIKSILTMIS